MASSNGPSGEAQSRPAAGTAPGLSPAEGTATRAMGISGDTASAGKVRPQGAAFDKSGRYQIMETLGSGGMGVVYKALDMRLGRFVAIKRLSGAVADDPEQLDSFLREARLLAQLRHFNLPEIYDIDEDDQGPFISMEFIAGSNLVQQLKAAGKMDPAAALEIVEQLCGALAVVHARGIVHRDIKPGNVLITQDGVPKLIDFGIARGGTSAAGHKLNVDMSVAGTPSYSSPEQRADADKADARSDLYSLGASLYALLTAESPAKMQTANLPAPVRPLIAKACAPDPAGRFQNADEFRKAVRKLIDELPVKTADAPAAEVKIEEDDRPLLDRLRDEVAALMNKGSFQEAVGVWERIGRITKNTVYAQRQVDRCKAMVRQREVRRLLENVGRCAAQAKFDDADAAVKEVYRLDPGNLEAVAWQDALRAKRAEQVKKLFFDAKSLLFQKQHEIAQQNVERAIKINRDPQMQPRLAGFIQACKARTALMASDKALKDGDRQTALEHATVAKDHLSKAIEFPRGDPLFTEVDNRLAQVAGAERARTGGVFRWFALAAASPGLALATVGPLFFGSSALVWALSASGPLLAIVGALRLAWAKRLPMIESLSVKLDELAERQSEGALLSKITFGLLGAMVLFVLAIGIFASLRSSVA